VHEPSAPAPAAATLTWHAATVSRTLIAEATRRSGVVWVSADGTDPRLVWHLWHADALWLVGGGAEQDLPPLADRAVVVVRSRASQSDRVVEWEADVSRVAPGTPAWDEVVPLLAAERLNAASTEDLPARWAASATVLRLAPRD
jgi:hypothetical protein